MDDLKTHLQDISEIRSLMAKSAKFLSLSGLSGVSAGVCALIGAAAAWNYMGGVGDYHRGSLGSDYLNFFLLDAFLVLVGALASASFFSIRYARKKDLPIWNQTAKHMLLGLGIPLVTGGIFCLIMLWHGLWMWVAPTTLIFYGLALLNAGKFTVNEVQWLGITEVVLGLIGAYFTGWGLYLWALGFGVIHVVYGALMYLKYER